MMNESNKVIYIERQQSLIEAFSVFSQDHNYGQNQFNKLVSEFEYILTSAINDKQKTLVDLEKSFLNTYTYDVYGHFLEVFCLYLINKNYPKIKQSNYPEAIKLYFHEDFERALKNVRKFIDQKKITFNDYIIYSYFEVLTLKRIPVGHQNLAPSGFSRKLFLKQSLKDKLRLFNIYMRGGNTNYYEMHYNPHRMKKFNLEGWEEVMKNTTDFLRINPKAKGIIGASWFFDPQLETISPELSYIRTIIKTSGGQFFYNGSSDEDLKNAFAFSKARKDAYEKGTYIPKNYLFIIKMRKQR